MADQQEEERHVGRFAPEFSEELWAAYRARMVAEKADRALFAEIKADAEAYQARLDEIGEGIAKSKRLIATIDDVTGKLLGVLAKAEQHRANADAIAKRNKRSRPAGVA
jgi:hypothetical protein